MVGRPSGRVLCVFLLVLSFLFPALVARGGGYALEFAGQTDYVTVGDKHFTNFVHQTLVFTVEFWFVVDSSNLAGQQNFIGNASNIAGNVGFYIRSLGDGKIRTNVDHANSAATRKRIETGAVIKPDTWMHLALAGDGTRTDLYLDGQLIGQASGAGSGTANATALLAFGESGGDYQDFFGKMDEIRIWRVARSSSEILENMKQELVGDEAGLVGYWRLNEGTGAIAYDSTANQNHGKVVGASWTTDTAPVAPQSSAFQPVPADRATDVPQDVVLGWTPGPEAQTHNVYLGTDPAKVSSADAADPLGVLVGQGLAATTFAPADLQYGQEYYWRVDGIGAGANTVFKGNVWSFTVEPYGYPIRDIQATASSAQLDIGPRKTIDGSGLNSRDEHSTEQKDMWMSTAAGSNWIQYEFDAAYTLHELWIWNANQVIEQSFGFGAKDVRIDYSIDGDAWTELKDVPPFNQGTGFPDYACNTVVDMGGVVARYVRLTIQSTWGDLPMCSLSEVRFFYIPVQARGPVPGDGATGIDLDPTLSWRPGREATAHTVYFSKDIDAVIGAAAPRVLTDHSFSPGTLEFGTTYFWRVDEVGETGACEGEVWSFTTPPFELVDDMESYRNVEPLEIWATWLDGTEFGTNDPTNGSVVGVNPVLGDYNAAPGRNGGQSLPIWYANTASAAKSEAVRTSSFGDWTRSGIKSLSLWFRGDPANSGGRLYVRVNSGAPVFYEGAPADIKKANWLPFNVDLSKVGAAVSNVTKLAVGVDGVGDQGVVYIDDIRLYPRMPEYVTPVQPDAANLLAYYDFEGNANDRSGHGLNGTIVAGLLVSPGKLGQGMALQVNDAGYADLGNPALLDFGTGDWAVTAWFKTAMTGTGDDNKGTIVGKGGDNTGGHRYALIMSEATEGAVTLVCDDDVTKEQAHSTTKTNNDEWHFVAGQREGTSIRIYVDGQLEAAEPVAADYNLSGTSQHNAYIGAITNHATGVLYKTFIGLVDEVRIYNRALSEAEILGLAGRTAPVAKPF